MEDISELERAAAFSDGVVYGEQQRPAELQELADRLADEWVVTIIADSAGDWLCELHWKGYPDEDPYQSERGATVLDAIEAVGRKVVWPK